MLADSISEVKIDKNFFDKGRFLPPFTLNCYHDNIRQEMNLNIILKRKTSASFNSI